MAVNSKGLLTCFLFVILLAAGFNDAGGATSSDSVLIKRISSPKFDGTVEENEWLGAAQLGLNFTFANGENHKAWIYLARNDTHFFVGAVIRGAGPNPFTVPDKVVFPDGFYIYFDVNSDGKMTQPEDAKGLLNFIGFREGKVFWDGTFMKDSFWNSESKSSDELHKRRPEITGEVLWEPDSNVKGLLSTYGSGDYSGGMNGDEHFEFTFPLWNNDTVADGFQVRTGEGKTVGFALEFYRQTYSYENGTEGQDLYDYWPGEGFTPNVIIHPSEWAKLSINLGDTINNVPDLRALSILIVVIAILVILAWRTVHRLFQRNRADE